MEVRRIRFLGQEWDVTPQGMGVGVATGHVPNASRWLAEFRCVSDPECVPLKAYIREADPSSLREEELQRVLALAVLIENLKEKGWATPAGLEAGTGIPEDAVTSLLDGAADIVERRTGIGPGPCYGLGRTDGGG